MTSGLISFNLPFCRENQIDIAPCNIEPKEEMMGSDQGLLQILFCPYLICDNSNY